MGRISAKQIIVLFAVTSLMIPFHNCTQDVEFDGIASQSSLGNTPDEGIIDEVNNGETTQITERFNETVSKSEGQVDLIWIVDNSGSMGTEAAIVRNNLASFLNFIKDASDFKFKLISKRGNDDNNVSLPFPSSEQFSQIDQEIGSHDSIKQLRNIVNSGDLDDFFRPGALKYIVFVTDDNSDLSKGHLLDLFSEEFPEEILKVSGFIGLGGVISPCQKRTGLVYSALALKTGGYMFNICKEDWSENFDKLANHIVESANNKFKLSYTNIKSIDKVTVNGNDIDLSKVDLSGYNVFINTDIKSYAVDDKLSIEITYTINN